MNTWAIVSDPYTKDLENSENEYYYIEDVLAWVKIPSISDQFLLCRVKARDIVNGSSIPWWIQWLIPRSGKQNRPSAFHDRGFKQGGLEFFIGGEWRFLKLTQKEVDTIYLNLMKCREVAKWNRNSQYLGLRAGGWIQWNKYRKQDKRKAS